MEYFHKDLCHLLSVKLSNLSLAAAAAAAASPNQSEEVVAMRNDTLPVSLLFRANLFKDGFMLPRRVNCLKLISNNKDFGIYAFPLRNLNWNTDSLRFYAEKQAITLANLHTSLHCRIYFCTYVGQNEPLLMHL